ncbi:MAG TPA: IPT/TIG domain-containing protein [Actinoplanes sp.]|nr:IPT/TIG domain-containing protein [Actinoplanes sp.]
MRKSQSTSGIRPLRAGIAVAATAAAAVVGLAAPAYAADVAVTTTPTQASTAGGQVITFSGTNVLNLIADATAGARWILSTATCGAAYDTANNGTAGGTATKSDASSGTVVLPALALGTYKLCLYATAAPGGAIAGHSTTTVSVVPFAPVPGTGPITGGDFTLTSTGAFTTATGTLGVTYTAAATTCPDKYTPTAPSTTILTGTAVKSGNNAATVTVPNTLLAGVNYQVCVYGGTVAASSSLLVRSTGAMTVKPAISISPRNGPAATAYTLTASTATPVITNASPVAHITSGFCPATYNGSSVVDPFVGVVTKISNSKVAVAVPTGVTTANPTAAFNVCVYNGTGNALVGAPATLTVAPALSFSGVTVSVNGGTAAGTGDGPAQGGSLVTITGISGLPTQDSVNAGATLTARFGNSPLTGLTVSGSTITGTTSPHAAGAETLTVTTAAGSATSASIFTFSYGITTAPNTALYESVVTLDILGSGFDLLGSASAKATNAAVPGAGVGVFLVNNSWYGTAEGNDIVAAGLVAQCANVIKISDVELICTLDLGESLDASGFLDVGNSVARGVYNVALVNDASTSTVTVDSNVSRISSSSVFTVADY